MIRVGINYYRLFPLSVGTILATDKLMVKSTRIDLHIESDWGPEL